MEQKEKISVLMGIYNCEGTLREAIDSILNQTYENWELILCDDGSSDGTFAVAKEYQARFPDRIILLRNEENRGLNFTLNRCFKASSGEWIARQDGDDISLPGRFEKEAAALLSHPELAIVSCDMVYFDNQGEWGRSDMPPFPQPEILVTATPHCHAPCMMRREAFLAVGGYTEDKRLLRVEDRHLWLKMYHMGYRGMNLKEPLYRMRDGREAASRRKFRYRLNEAYVSFLAVKAFSFPVWKYFLCFRPLLIGLLPGWAYRKLHRKKLS